VNGLRRIHGTKIGSVGIDDTLRYFDVDVKKYLSGESTKLNRQPKAIAHSGSVTAVVTVDSIIIFRDGSLTHEESLVRKERFFSCNFRQRRLNLSFLFLKYFLRSEKGGFHF